MRKLDTLILNTTVMSAGGRIQGSVGIRDGLIVDIYSSATTPEAEETIHGEGLVLLPGGVDMHSHHRQGSELGGFEYKETIETATRQCAAGGITTSVAMPNVRPVPNTVEELEKLFKVYERESLVDWNVNPAGTILEEIPGLAEMGIAGFKIFMVVDTGRDYPHMPGIGVHDHGRIMAIMEACEKADKPLMVHPHDQALMDHIEKEFWDRGERDALAYAKAYAAHDGIIWDTAIQMLLRLQKATGVHLHTLHTQTSGSVDLIRNAKEAGGRVSCEINPWALFLGNEWGAIERLGSYALSYYVPEKNTPVLWDALNSGAIDIVASDHAPHLSEEKEIGWTDGWKAHTGTPSTQHYLSMLLDASSRGLIELEKVVEVTANNPARLFGLEQKGEIAVGKDADLVLVDLNEEFEIRDDETLGLIGWSPYAGRSLKGAVKRTLLRGRTIYEDGVVSGEKGYGRQAVAHRKSASASALTS